MATTWAVQQPGALALVYFACDFCASGEVFGGHTAPQTLFTWLCPANSGLCPQVDAPEVEVNALRATLGAKPLPYPVAGAVSGHMQCYGLLDEPVFAGRIDAAQATPGMVESGPGGDAQDALLRSRDEGPAPALLTYDKVPLRCASSKLPLCNMSCFIRLLF